MHLYHTWKRGWWNDLLGTSRLHGRILYPYGIAMGRTLIVDEYTDLKVSRQRKWQLRHPEQQKAMVTRWRDERGGRAKLAASQKRWQDKNKETTVARKEPAISAKRVQGRPMVNGGLHRLTKRLRHQIRNVLRKGDNENL